MKTKEIGKQNVVKSKQLGIVIALIVIAVAAIAGLTIKSVLDSMKEFPGDGYVLVPSEKKDVTTEVNEQYYFSAGTSYRERYQTNVSFKDTSGKKVTTDTTEFVHYLDGSLSSFTKGVILGLTDVANEQVTYYGVSNKTTITKNGSKYQVSYMGDSMDMGEFIWKITDNKYMVVSPQVTLHLNDETDIKLDDYVQLQYVEGGIVRLAHQKGTYQTVADNAYLTTDSGVQLNLMSKKFVVNGEEALSLNDMVIDSSSNLELDENEDSVKIPTFNVVNGKDGTSGEEGEEGKTGETGEEGTSGESGEDGGAGRDGKTGQNAQDGYDGLEGNSGGLGYDGKDGNNGNDAPNNSSSDGIASINQKKVPTVSLDTENYTVGPNSISFNLAISDPEGMLDDDLILKIYSRADMKEAYKQIIPRGVTSAAVSTNTLLPDTEYVIVVSGSYTTEEGTYDTDFFTKIFSTDSLGVRLEKVQVTDNSIKVKTTVAEDAMVGSYQVALYEADGVTKISNLSGTYSNDQEFVFDATQGLENGKTISPNTEYKVKLINVIGKDSTAIGADVYLDLLTLKTSPYYNSDVAGNVIPIASKKANAVSSERYQTVTVSLDTAIQDPHNGIRGYRYELYEALGTDITGSEPVAVKEVQGMQSVSFNVERDQGYVGRVVVIFDDNEKEVELPSAYSNYVSLSDKELPTVSFDTVKWNYDSIEGYVKVVDNKGLLLPNISADYPLVLNMTSEAGSTICLKLTDANIVYPNGVSPSETEKYFRFSQDGLRRNTTYSISVLGPFNDSDKAWGALNDDEKKLYSEYYLAGTNVNTGDPNKLVARFRQEGQAVDNGIFAIHFGITANVGDDVAYEVGNLEKVSFRLIKENTGEVLGEVTLTDRNKADLRHESDFSNIYSEAGTPEGTQKYSDDYILTANSFNANDSRVSGGGNFRIELVQGVDYTTYDTSTNYENEMDWEEDSKIFQFTLQESHTQTDPNNAVMISQIQNKDAEDHAVAGLADDTVVGLKIAPDYSWEDVRAITYYIYEITEDGTQPQFGDGYPLDDTNWKRLDDNTIIQPIATKTFQLSSSTVSGKPLTPWTVYFDDMTSSTGNQDGNGNPIFERGKKYFVRYRVETDGSVTDAKTNPYYPDCVYPGTNPQDVPYYRSQVFALERELPKVQRYLDATNTDSSGNTIQTWRYLLTDPDGAVKAWANKEGKTAPEAVITTYPDFASGVEGANGTQLGTPASLAALYDANTVKGTYEQVDMNLGTLAQETFYTVEIPYLACTGADERKIVENPVSARAVSTIRTDILTSSTGDPTHQNTDYSVPGVMLKGIGTESGIKDDWGYRIKLTLQGEDIFHVAALRVTLTSKDTPAKSIVFDPVEVHISDGRVGTGSTLNNYGYAYLDYAPIVRAGLAQKDVTVKVEAYYNTYQAGMKLYNDYAAANSTINHDGDVFAVNDTAWALKRVSYTTGDAGTSCNSAYLQLDENGLLKVCPTAAVTTDKNAPRIQTASGSVFLPNSSFDALGTSEVAIQGAMYSLCTSSLTDGTYADILRNQSLPIQTDAVGMVGDDGYYVLEKLEMKQLQIDCGDAAKSYKTCTIHTGDGMPGVQYDETSSIGRNSATIKFMTKGQVPNAVDKGIYLYLYDVNGNKLPMYKYRDDDGRVYYQMVATSDSSITPIAKKDDGTEEDGGGYEYGTEITKEDADIDGNLSFVIQGLEPNTVYSVKVMAKNTTSTTDPTELFDYEREIGGVNYKFTTTREVEMEAEGASWEYNTYTNKLGFVRFAIKGYDGMNMRIYYNVYPTSGDTNTPINMSADSVGRSYVPGKGYLIPTLGQKIPYYDSDMSRNNTANIEFSPGKLQLNTSYKVVLTAYESDLSGKNVTNDKIGTKEITIKTPATMERPYASLRVAAGVDNINIRVTMTDTNRVIVDDTYTVEVLDSDGNVKWSQDVVLVNSKEEWAGQAVGLETGKDYQVRVTANADLKNCGTKTYVYENYASARTTTAPTATVISYRDNGAMVLKLNNRTNFDNVAKILYSVDSEDGRENYANGQVTKDALEAANWGISIPDLTEGETYHYSIQYYDANGTYLGSTNGEFK